MARQSLTDAFKNAGAGIVKTSVERNFRIELGFLVLVVVLGLFYHISVLEWAVVFVCCALVLGGECLNSSLEAIVDLASPDYHELAGKAKDCAAGAVLVFSLGSLAVGVIIFLPRIAQTVGLC